MARELNRDLFGARPAAPETTAQAQATIAAEQQRALFLHVEAMSKKLREYDARLETTNIKLEDVTKQTKQRFERVQGHFKSQDEMIKHGFMDCHHKVAQVISRVNERKVADNVVKDMVERHTSIVQSFEVRLNQLQRVISDQEMQLMSARAELKDALQTLTRLKKL